MKITQSFLKDIKAYLSGQECGGIIQAIWVDGKQDLRESDAMKLGTFFEYHAFGNKPRNGKIPQPEYQPSKIKAKLELKKNAGKTEAEILDQLTINDAYADYVKAYNNAQYTKLKFAEMGFEVIEVGHRLTYGRFQGEIDLKVRCTKEIVFDDEFTLHVGDIIVIDFKYSGLGDNKWDKMGYAGLIGENQNQLQKDYHGIQAKQYHLVSGKLPFFFWIQNPNNMFDVLFLRAVINEQALENFKVEANGLMQEFEYLKEVGFEKRPNYKRCSVCPIAGECNEKHTFPHAIAIDLTE